MPDTDASAPPPRGAARTTAASYPYAALEPTIDELTMRIHHGKHHGTYVANLNAALSGTRWENLPVEQLLADLDRLPHELRATVRNNAGGHANHALFWERSWLPMEAANRLVRSTMRSKRPFDPSTSSSVR